MTCLGRSRTHLLSLSWKFDVCWFFGRVKYEPDHWTLGLLDYFLDLSIDYRWGRGGGGWEIVLVLLINGVLTGSYKQFSRLTILCQGFCAELLRFFNFCHANARLEICQFPFSILLCWVTRVPFKSTCSSAKWYSLVTTGHKPVTSRFPLCILLYKVYHYEFYLSFFFFHWSYQWVAQTRGITEFLELST